MDNIKDGQVQIVRGHINIIILKALNEGEKYGYEIGKYIESASEGSYTLKQPTLYSSLKRLEDKEIISSYWGDEQETNGGRRKYFRLTELGKTIADKNISEWNESRNIIDKIIHNSDKKTPKAKISIPEERFSSFSEQNFNQNATQNKSDIIAGQVSIDDGNITRLNNRLYSEENRQDTVKNNEYKSVLSKLLNNVKNDETKTEEVKKDSFLFSNEKNIVEETLPKYDTLLVKEDSTRKNNFNEVDEFDKRFNANSFLSESEKDYKINDDNLNKPSAANKLDEIDLYSANRKAELSQRQDLKSGESNFSLLPSSSSKYAQNNFLRLQQEMQQQGYNIRPHTNLKKQNTKQYLLANKLTYMSMILLYAIMCIETFVIYYLFEPVLQIGFMNYVYAALILLIFPFSATVQYLIYPNKKSKRKYYPKNVIISSVMVFLILVLAITSIALVFNVNIGVMSEMLKIIIPSIYAFNYVIYAVIWSIIYSGKKCFA